MTIAHTSSDVVVDGIIIFTMKQNKYDIPRTELHVQPFEMSGLQVCQSRTNFSKVKICKPPQ